MQISFIGGGLMAEAIIAGILGANLAGPRDIRVGEPLELRRAQLTKNYGITTHSDNLEMIKNVDMIVISVKPQILPNVMGEISEHLDDNQTVMSIVAGARLNTLVSGLDHPAIIRVMPNTPAQIGEGMIVWTSSTEVPEKNIAAGRDILRTLGEEYFVEDEKLMDMATALSASGPAYVFLFIESLIDSGVYMGMPRNMAREVVIQTVIGSTRLLQESGRHPAELKDMVSSPGGGTVEALMTFEREGFRAAILQAVSTAYHKYQELGETT